MLPLVTTPYEMQRLEVLVPTLTGNLTTPLKYISSNSHCQASIQKSEQETATACVRDNVVMIIKQRLSPLFPFGAAHLTGVTYVRHVNLNRPIVIVITTTLVMMVTLIAITVLPKLTLFWV